MCSLASSSLQPGKILTLSSLLFYVQIKNFCLAQTTSERFGRQRTASVDSSVTSSDSFVDNDSRRGLSEQRRRMSENPKPSCGNCLSMCCNGKVHDQNSLVDIRSITGSRISSSPVHGKPRAEEELLIKEGLRS